jgi:glutaredoxin 3
MPNIEIYTTSNCGYCTRAKRLLANKGLQFREIDVSYDYEARAALMLRADGRRTLPQVFIGETHVGGCDELHALEAKGGLDALLASA